MGEAQAIAGLIPAQGSGISCLVSSTHQRSVYNLISTPNLYMVSHSHSCSKDLPDWASPGSQEVSDACGWVQRSCTKGERSWMRSCSPLVTPAHPWTKFAPCHIEHSFYHNKKSHFVSGIKLSGVVDASEGRDPCRGMRPGWRSGQMGIS